MRIFSLLAIPLFLLAGCQTPPPNPFADISETTFDEMISLVAEKHFETESAGIDWQQLHAQYIDRVRQCTSPTELAVVLNQALSELHHSHITLLLPEDPEVMMRLQSIADGMAVPSKNANETDDIIPIPQNIPNVPPGDVGIKVGLANGRIYVTRISPGSSADSEGVRIGDRIVGIGFQIPDGMLTQKVILSKPDIPWAALAQMKLAGDAGSTCKVRLLDSENQKREVTLTRIPNGLEWTQMGVMPAEIGNFESTMLDSQIGYITFSPCMSSQIFNARRAIVSLQKKGMKGLILDLRGNPGGLGSMAAALCGTLTDTPMLIVREISRNQIKENRAYPQPGAFLGPVTLLIDGTSASSSELLAAGLKDNNRARLFGTATAGQCLGSNFFELSTGFRLQTVLCDIVRINGKKIEGVGVEPDVKIQLKSAVLKTGKDNVLEAAADYLKTQI